MASYYLHVKAALALSITFSANPFKEFLSPKFTPEKIELRYRAALSNDSYRSSRCSGSRVVFDTSPHERPVVGRADFALARRWPSPAPPWRFRFYKDVSGLEIIYGGEGSYFTSLRTKDGNTILNLEHGSASISHSV